MSGPWRAVMRPICQDAQLTPSTVRYRRAEWVITLNKCTWHISVAPLYITGVKRWVQVCTCTDLSVQIHSQSNGSFWVLHKNIKDLIMLIIVKYSITNISACKIGGHHCDPKKYAIY